VILYPEPNPFYFVGPVLGELSVRSQIGSGCRAFTTVFGEYIGIGSIDYVLMLQGKYKM